VRRIGKDGSLLVENDDHVRKTLTPSQRLFVRGYAVTAYASQGKTVDTVLLADSGNASATNCNQWYVAISRGRRKALVFTGEKAALRADIERSGARELALELKASAPVLAKAERERIKELPSWLVRSRETLERARRFRFVQNLKGRQRQMHINRIRV
jgi:hypothetical protein